MKNVLTVTNLTNLENGTLCPFELHKALGDSTTICEPNFEVVEKMTITKPKQYGTVLHAIIQYKLAHPYSKYRYKHPNIAAEADKYINWAKSRGYVNRRTKVEQTVVTTLENEYMPTAQLIGRPDLVTRNKFGQLVIIDWKTPKAQMCVNYWQQVKIYAAQIMAANGKFEDTLLIVYNGHENMMHISAAEAERTYHNLSDICTAAVANSSPTKPTDSCASCDYVCDSIYQWVLGYIGRWRGDGARLAPYQLIIDKVFSDISADSKAAIAAGMVPGASAPSGRSFECTPATVEEYESHCEATGHKAIIKHTKKVLSADFVEECGKEAAEKYKTKLNGKYKYPSLF